MWKENHPRTMQTIVRDENLQELISALRSREDALTHLRYDRMAAMRLDKVRDAACAGLVNGVAS